MLCLEEVEMLDRFLEVLMVNINCWIMVCDCVWDWE